MGPTFRSCAAARFRICTYPSTVEIPLPVFSYYNQKDGKAPVR